MSDGDVFRWAFIFICLFNVGAIAALYQRAGKLIKPKLWVRMLMISNVSALIVIAIGLHARLGQELTWRSPALAVSAGLELVALLGLHRWYQTPRGRKYVLRMAEDHE